MPVPSTADSVNPAAAPKPTAERGAVGPGATHADVEGEVSPRLPHERDESSDSGTTASNEVMELASKDLQKGRVDAPRGPQTQADYSRITQQSADSVKRG